MSKMYHIWSNGTLKVEVIVLPHFIGTNQHQNTTGSKFNLSDIRSYSIDPTIGHPIIRTVS